jgi:hypothetical protein
MNAARRADRALHTGLGVPVSGPLQPGSVWLEFTPRATLLRIPDCNPIEVHGDRGRA